LSFATCTSIGFASAAVALPLLLQNSMKLDISYYGIIQAVFSAGALVGSLWMGRQVRRRRTVFGFGVAVALGLCLFVAALPISIYGIAVAWFLRGVAVTVFGLTWIGTLQRLVPRNMLGRVASIDDFVSVSMLVTAFIGAGLLAQHVHPEVIFLIGGAIVMLVPSLALTRPSIRKLE
jgi:DHA3 family tetracycline resistance protein-like MFS transporter